MQQRMVLVVASQCDALSPLSFVPQLGTDLFQILVDSERGDCQPAAGGLLLDPERESALEHIETAFQQANDAGALLILAFLGHGIAIDEDFYFLTKDSEGTGSSRKDLHLSQSLKENLRMHGNLDGLGVLLDTCQSGRGAQQASQWREVGLGAHLRRYEMLTAAADQPAFDGIFTKTIISILRDGIPVAGPHLRATDLRAPLQSACVGQRPQHIAHDGGVWAPKEDKGIWFAHNVATNRSSDDDAVQSTVDIQDRLKQLPTRDRGPLFDLWRQEPGEVGRVIYSFTAIDVTPTDVLESWEKEPPAWISTASVAGLKSLAILASSYGYRVFSARLYEAAAESTDETWELWSRAASYYYLTDNGSAARSIVERIPTDVTQQDPSLRAVLSLLDQDWPSLDAALSDWEPTDTEDRGIWLNLKYQHIFVSPGENSITQQMLDSAIQVTERMLSEEWLPGFALQKARYLIERARRSWSLQPLSDLNEATDLALRARDERRSWNGDSADAVSTACRALLEAGDVERVLIYGTNGDSGEATESEAASAEVRETVALAKLALGMPEEAVKLAESITNPYNRARILALASRRSGRESEDLWREALAAATEDHEEIVALHGLARCGVSNLPELAKYAEEHPQMVAEIEAVADIAGGRMGTGLRTLQSSARESEAAAISLALAYISIDDVDAAVQVYENAASDFRDPSYGFEAAQVLFRADRHNEAFGKLNDLLAMAPSPWSGRTQALRLAAHLSLENGDRADSLRLFRALLAAEPADASARWAVVQLLLQQDDTNGAWRTFSEHPFALEASTPAEANAWIHLNVESNGDVESVVAGCLRLMRKFPDSEEVAAQSCLAILRPKYQSVELPDELADEIRQAHESFFIRWPDSPYFKRMDASDPQEVIKQMTAMVRVDEKEARRRRQLTTALILGQLPTGFLSTYSRRTYAQALITRSAGMITAWSHDARENIACVSSARTLFSQSVVYDLSAAVVLHELPARMRDAVLNFFRSTITTEAVLKDAREAAVYIDPRSTSTWGWDEVGNSGRFYDIPGELAEKRARDAVSLVDFVANSTLRERPSVRLLPHLPESLVNSWISPMELAKSTGLCLWVDDSALRGAARAAGVSVVSTPSILQVLTERGIISADDYEECVRSLMAGYVGDVPLSLPRVMEMARDEGFEDGSVSAIIGRPATWINVIDGLKILEALLKEARIQNSASVPIWVARAVGGAAYAGSSDSVARHDMIVRIIALSLHVTGFQGPSARSIFLAARQALGACAAECEVIDPVEKSVVVLRDAMMKIYTPAISNQYAMSVVSDLDDEDRRSVVAALLR
ncbi:hypothetical protein ACGFT2_01775 [Streptomyces sp. NPDC048514]|uniref:PIN domain-containing protein n=1 Tax=Streptomyces sp. NPDC048514 TaxID=3365564 RepID=UPI003724B680